MSVSIVSASALITIISRNAMLESGFFLCKFDGRMKRIQNIYIKDSVLWNMYRFGDRLCILYRLMYNSTNILRTLSHM